MDNQTKNSKARQTFVDRVELSLLGPGSEKESWGTPNIEEEIISDYPLLRYCTGILFPQKTEHLLPKEEEDDFLDNEEDDEGTIISEEEDENQAIEKQAKDKDEQEDSLINYGKNDFFPSSCGLTFCIDKSIQSITVNVKFGLYYEPEQNEIRIKGTTQEYKSIMADMQFPFKDNLKLKDDYLYFYEKLRGERKKRNESGDFAKLHEYTNFCIDNNSPITEYLPLFQKLTRRVWKRKQISKSITLKVSELNNKEGHIIYTESINDKHEIIAKLFTKRYEYKDYIYCKVLLVNDSTKQSWNRFSNHTEDLNRKAFFQSQIEVKATQISPYHGYEELNPLDPEMNLLNYIYKDVKNYAIGHNCATSWEDSSNNKNVTWVKTTFIPKYNIRETRNSFIKDDFNTTEDYTQIEDCLNIYNLSHFIADKNETIKKLTFFVNCYGDWVEKQKKEAANTSGKFFEVATQIAKNLESNKERLLNNIESLKDDRIFRAFTLANTAMFIQIILSNDKDFAKKEKYLSDFDENVNYKDISVFEGYNKFPIKYRPFQLAFLLLNINSITNKESKERDIVDLIWFPTGGGKTEAYLAVAAFTIIWRRMSNGHGYEGTSVIMRYTLRLLTAQQFERASRLIAALEFIRRNFIIDLKTDPITIGLWVGESSTPNKIESAKKIVTNLNYEASKGVDQGFPNDKNTFQVNSCPWCGAKLINKNSNNTWNIDAFKIAKDSFHFCCPNKKCAFHESLPIQVVDEMLYKEPPTLLFATVDKFAMLAWQENGHKFFNSFTDEGLPPDLVIQDELHLLSGALGSITAMYESVVEILCTKNNQKPKILASTATTRNTDSQIKQLYGNRKVNIFPPNGLSYSDSYFARESTTSKREYIGILPTGKTAVDMQLRLLSNLLVARVENLRKNDIGEECFNNYWTIVSYYNSLKDVGKTNNKIGEEVKRHLESLQKRILGSDNPNYSYNYRNLKTRVKELTSRENSGKIKQILSDLETPINICNDIVTEEDKKRIKDNVIDLVLATNMISVGIDISRLNIMLINGQPKNIAEYIQASSRVARKVEGLVISLYDSNNTRDKSYFEHFVPFHQAFYKFIEPLSITPFTENTIDKMLMTTVITYIRQTKNNCNKNNDVKNFQKENLDDFIKTMENRFGKNEYFEEKMKDLAENWSSKIEGENPIFTKYSDKIEGLMVKPQMQNSENQDRVVMQSMREVDTNTFIEISLKSVTKGKKNAN